MRCPPLVFLAMLILIGCNRPVEPQPVSTTEPAPALAEQDAVVNKPLERVLPGLQKGGFVQLPNQWQLKPVGKQIEIGDLPVNIALHPTGQFAAVLHAGFQTHEIIIIDLNPKKTHIVSRATIPQAFYGLAFSKDGKQLYASGGEFEIVHAFDFERGYVKRTRQLDVSHLDNDAHAKQRVVVGGLALDPAGKDLYVASPWGDCVVRVPLDNPENRIHIAMSAQVDPKKEPAKGDLPSPDDGRKDPNTKATPKVAPQAKPVELAYPYACLVEPGGKRAFVSLWGKSAVGVIDLEKNALIATWPTASHPTEMALAPDGKALYVACANSTQVSVLDPTTGKGVQTIICSLYPVAPSGNTPNSLTLTPDGQLLFVANADANNLSVFNVSDRKTAKSLGFIPTGWYPTSVRFNPLDKKLYVANGKGLISKPNRAGPVPGATPPNTVNEYIGKLLQGTLSIIDTPTPAQMLKYTTTAYECSPLRNDAAVRAEHVAPGNPIPKKVGEPSPIKYVIYVVKENRTYDQILGDLPQGNGDANLCLFPEVVTPNHHKLAREFVLLDNFYVDGEVSADGHQWTMGAYASDFVEKIWPLTYRGGGRGTFGYPSEGGNDQLERPAGGYLWNRCIDAKVTYRAYGEWVNNGKKRADGTFEDGKPAVPELQGRFDPQYRGYDLDYPDVKRAERFLSEVKRFEQLGEMPRVQVVRLPNDHTSGSRVGKPTVTAMVADNDLALGMLVEGISQSKFWKETAIFIIEDDAQNGPDHVDAHRVVALVVSPYTKRKFVDSTLYSTSSMLRTMELIQGLKPMSQFDAAARPMYNSFTAKPDFTPYQHVVPKIDRNAKNQAGALGAEESEKLNLAREDQADDLIFNQIIWQAVKGKGSRVPPPVRSAFFIPIKAKKADLDDDDDD